MAKRRAAPGDDAAPTTGERIGIVDIGSNSVRLVVYDGPQRLPMPIFNERVSCRLGRGLERSGRLDPDGVALALRTLTRFANLVKELAVGPLELLGTAAVREARDGPQFAAQVEEIFGREVRILSGAEEARLGALGILSGLPDADGLVGELGGGSLDLVVLDRGAFGATATMPLGHLRLSEAAKGKTKKAGAIIERHLRDAGWLKSIEGRNLYAVGGAWRGVARICIGQTNYPLKVLDNYTLQRDEAIELTAVIAGLSPSSLEKLDGVAKRRVDTLPFAALVLNRLLAAARPRALVFSGYSMREGRLFEMLPDEIKVQDPVISACEAFARRGGRFTVHGDEAVTWMAPLFPGEQPADRRLRRAVSLLSDIGWSEHPDYRALHAFLRVLRFPVAGLGHRDRILLALAVFIRYNGGRRQFEVAEVRSLLSEADEHLATTIGLALRLAHVLTGGVPGLLPLTTLGYGGGRLILRLSPNQDLFNGDAVERLFESLANLLGVSAEIV